MNKKKETYRITFPIPAEVHTQIKLYCVKEQMKLKEFFKEAIIEKLNHLKG